MSVNLKLFRPAFAILFGVVLLLILAEVILLNQPNLSYQVSSDCQCRRPFPWPQPPSYATISSCSDAGTFHNHSQRLISFSLFLDPEETGLRKLYSDGLRLNLEALHKLYPPRGYSIRVYTNETLKGPFCELWCQYPELFWCDVGKTPNLGDMSRMYFRTWRFLPLGDPTVEEFHSRDLDSVISPREAAVVRDWLQLPEQLPIYVMRDYQMHIGAILAGMWGIRNSGVPDVRQVLRKIVRESEIGETYAREHDQDVLTATLYLPKAARHVVAYDSYFCRQGFPDRMWRPFPVQRRNNETDWVGNMGLGRAKWKIKKCPKACRPSYGKHWEYC